MKYVFGIDFGTTSSAVVGCYVDDGSIRIDHFGDSEGNPIPSVIAIDKNSGEVFSGREAWEKRTELSDSCEVITSVKMILDEKKVKQIAGKDWTPEDIACELFKAMKNSVAEKTDNNQHITLNEAVVAIPVGFSPEKRNILRRAAASAGIRIKSFVSEPTAAFFANYDNLKYASTVAVFDWGGGTLDVSILRTEDGKIEELAKAGISIAGNAIDEKIARKIHARIVEKQKDKNFSFDDMPSNSKDRLLVRCEEAKRKLSDADSAKVMIVNYAPFGIVNEKIDYQWFSNLIQPEIEKAMDCLKTAITESKVGLANIDKILMVGGSSKLKPLQEKMKETYGDLFFYPEMPDWDIAQGAALFSSDSGENYSNQSIGIILSDNSFYEMLEKNIPLKNWRENYHFGITDLSKEVQFVFDGTEDIRNLQDRYRTLEVPSYRFLQEIIDVSASVDENLIFTVEAKSSMKPTKNEKIWQYANLKFYYKLPRG